MAAGLLVLRCRSISCSLCSRTGKNVLMLLLLLTEPLLCWFLYKEVNKQFVKYFPLFLGHCSFLLLGERDKAKERNGKVDGVTRVGVVLVAGNTIEGWVCSEVGNVRLHFLNLHESDKRMKQADSVVYYG